jgi:hypothetical protein
MWDAKPQPARFRARASRWSNFDRRGGLWRFERETEARWRYAQPSPLMPGLAKATPPSTVTVEPTT